MAQLTRRAGRLASSKAASAQQGVQVLDRTTAAKQRGVGETEDRLKSIGPITRGLGLVGLDGARGPSRIISAWFSTKAEEELCADARPQPRPRV
jgi:hypothetical protein